MGVSYTDYLRSLRLKFAVSLFDRGLDSVKNVALLSGFTDPLYFSTVFKKHIGLSPKEYKEKMDTK
jgi:AraC-like DNA-binding protein